MAVTEENLLYPKWFLETFASIKTKKRKIKPFIFKPVQKKYYHTLVDEYGHLRRGIYDIIFKSRQHGFTSEIMSIFLHDTITNEGTSTLIILHKQKDAMKKMQDLKFIFKSIPEEYRPVTEYDTKYEMTFPELNSSISIAWATDDLGRSQTYHNVLCSEVAFWKCDVEEAMGGLAETCQKENGGNLVIESTPNGMGSWFHKEVMRARRGDSPFKLHEYGWWTDPEHRVEPDDQLEEGEAPLSDEEKRLMEEEDLTLGQIRWRRRKIQNTPGGKRVFSQEQELSFLQSGTKVFDPSYLHLYAPNTEPKEGYALGVHVYEEPEPGRTYLIGADTAEGLKDGDYHSATVLDMETGIEVASLHYKWSRDEYARKLDWLGRKYNKALIGVERQNHGHDILGRLQDGRGNKHDKPYPNLYWHIDYDATGRSWKLGFPTTTKTKPIMINELEEALRKTFILLASQSIVDELQVYEVKDNGSTGAPEGYHDDRVMSTAIAWQLRKAVDTHQPGDNEQDIDVITA